jgi:leucyl aminopeptidase (aminopeptidase T)
MPLLKLQKASRIALKDYMGLDEGETLLVLSDEKMREIGLSLYEAGTLIAKESFYLEIKSRDINGQEPPEQISELMKSVDVVVAATSKSLTHTKARRDASKLGVRVGTMPNISEETMIRCLNPNVDKVIDITRNVFNALQDVSKVRVTSKKGTDITFEVTGRQVIPSTGVLRNIGESGNIPSGEVYLAPIEGSSNGMLVFDGSIAGIGILAHPVYIEVINGIATKISGKGGEARLFGRMINRYDNDSKSIAEFGIGTNPYAKICGEILEDEKVLGTVHFAFGNNISMGGTINVPLHIDGLINKPTVYFDGKKVMEDGKLLFLNIQI